MGNLEERLNALEQSNAKLERHNHWLWTIVLAGVAIVAVSGVAGWPFQPSAGNEDRLYEVLHAEQFVLLDNDGNMRAELVTHNGEPGLRLFDTEGITRAAIGMVEGEPRFVLADANGNPRAELRTHYGESGISLLDANGNTRAALATTDGSPALGLLDADGNAIWSAP